MLLLLLLQPATLIGCASSSKTVGDSQKGEIHFIFVTFNLCVFPVRSVCRASVQTRLESLLNVALNRLSV